MLTIRWNRAALAAGLVFLAGCATPAPPPPPPPPPPPVVEVAPVPYRPIPPGGAPYVMQIPGVDAAGQRLSVNHAVDEMLAVWHFRSGWNVAALNCTSQADAQIIDAYGSFLSRFQRDLSAINTALDRRYRQSEGSTRAGTRAREADLTQVYNYFAQPAARADFCAAARAISAAWVTAQPTELNSYAMANLALFENAFENFFRQYEEYQVLSAAWDREYGARYGASQPGYVAVYGAQTSGVPASLVASEVIDPLTGAAIPVIPASEGAVATPVVQPLPAAGPVTP